MSVTFHCSDELAPSANFANVNAGAILRLLGLYGDGELWGSCEAGKLRQRILRARNNDRTAAIEAPYELEPGHAGTAVVTEDGITRLERRGPRVISFGNTDRQTLRRLEDLDQLAIWAQWHQHAIIYWG